MNIVITGASKGLGLAIAKAFATEGNNIAICSRNESELKTAKETLIATNATINVYYKVADLSQAEACKNFGIWCAEIFDKIDVLVNNAGFFIPGQIYNEPTGQLEQMINVNLMSAYHLTRQIVPTMIKQASGHIFNVTSVAGLQAYDNGGSYSISKYAMQGFNDNLRKELMPHGIKVTAIIPGAAYTNSWSGSGIDPKRIMEASDVATMVLAATKTSAQAVVEQILLRPQLGDL